jgi:hypothetical protein
VQLKQALSAVGRCMHAWLHTCQLVCFTNTHAPCGRIAAPSLLLSRAPPSALLPKRRQQQAVGQAVRAAALMMTELPLLLQLQLQLHTRAEDHLLTGHERAVRATAHQELLMRATFCYAALMHHDNLPQEGERPEPAMHRGATPQRRQQ